MAQIQTQAIAQDKFLMLSVNLLHKALVEPTRTETKTLYKALSEGKAVPLATVQMEDKSNARFSLALEHSEFRGKLNYGAFRGSVTTLINNISQALTEEKELKVFNAQQEGGAMIFGVTALTVEDGEPNVMVLAAEPGTENELTKLQLMYLDPQQFAAAADSGSEEESTA
jgi:hypothetical protein